MVLKFLRTVWRIFEIVQLCQISMCRAAQDDLPAALREPLQQRVELVLPARRRPVDDVAVSVAADCKLRREMLAQLPGRRDALVQPVARQLPFHLVASASDPGRFAPST